MKQKIEGGKKDVLEVNIEPKDYSFTDYPLEEILDWLYEKKVITYGGDEKDYMNKRGKLIIKWKEYL